MTRRQASVPLALLASMAIGSLLMLAGGGASQSMRARARRGGVVVRGGDAGWAPDAAAGAPHGGGVMGRGDGGVLQRTRASARRGGVVVRGGGRLMTGATTAATSGAEAA